MTKLSSKYVQYADTVKKRLLAFKSNPGQSLADVYKKLAEFSPSYSPNDAVIELVCKGHTSGCHIRMPSGLFNFIERVQKSDIYSYAVFPKNEVAGVFSNSSVDLAVSGQTQGNAWLSVGRGRQESQLESTLVGFGDGRYGNQNERDQSDRSRTNQEGIQFGWVLSSNGKMAPTQKTELALISVPAWTTRLKLTIKTGWLDRDANENTEPPFDMEVPVPPDFQAFDSLIIEGQHQRRPKIRNDLMSTDLKVVACSTAKILIPGSRLWRSATVTLGAQKADRITVLPNMEGIIAEFKQVDIPHSGNDGDSKTKLQVWTSEGVDTAEKEVGILNLNKGYVCP
jgi:hypothetical protein